MSNQSLIQKQNERLRHKRDWNISRLNDSLHKGNISVDDWCQEADKIIKETEPIPDAVNIYDRILPL